MSVRPRAVRVSWSEAGTGDGANATAPVTYTVPWRSSPMGAVVAAFAVGWTALWGSVVWSFLSVDAPGSAGPWWSGALFLAFLYWACVRCVNGTTVTVSATDLRGGCGPLPWRERRVPAQRLRDCVSFGVERVEPRLWTRLGEGPWWRVWSVGPRGVRRLVADRLFAKDHAAWLCAELTNRLAASGDAPKD